MVRFDSPCTLTVVERQEARKNRYISFRPSDPGSVAYQVELTASAYFPGSSGVLGWVGEPFEAPEDPGVWIARVVDTAYFSASWPELLHLGDCPIVPAATYALRATPDGINFEDPHAIETILEPAPKKWGDVVGEYSEGEWTPPNGVVNMDDVMAAVQKFLDDPNAPHLTWIDVEGEEPNAIVNMTDILQIVRGFKGEPYPFSDPVLCP